MMYFFNTRFPDTQFMRHKTNVREWPVWVKTGGDISTDLSFGPRVEKWEKPIDSKIWVKRVNPHLLGPRRHSVGHLFKIPNTHRRVCKCQLLISLGPFVGGNGRTIAIYPLNDSCMLKNRVFGIKIGQSLNSGYVHTVSFNWVCVVANKTPWMEQKVMECFKVEICVCLLNGKSAFGADGSGQQKDDKHPLSPVSYLDRGTPPRYQFASILKDPLLREAQNASSFELVTYVETKQNEATAEEGIPLDILRHKQRYDNTT